MNIGLPPGGRSTVRAVPSLRQSIAREPAPDILHLSADMFHPNTMAARDLCWTSFASYNIRNALLSSS